MISLARFIRLRRTCPPLEDSLEHAEGAEKKLGNSSARVGSEHSKEIFIICREIPANHKFSASKLHKDVADRPSVFSQSVSPDWGKEILSVAQWAL